MECRTLSSRLTSKDGSSKVMVSGGSEMRYVSKGLLTQGQTPSGSHISQIQSQLVTHLHFDSSPGHTTTEKLIKPKQASNFLFYSDPAVVIESVVKSYRMLWLKW